MRGLRHGLRACGAGLFIAVAAPMALAASDQAPSSSPAAKAGDASATHHDAKTARPRHAGKPAPPKAANHHEHKDLAVRPTSAGHAGSADKSHDRASPLGSFSLGVETDPKVKPRSLAGGEVEFDREPGVRSKNDPWYLGLSIKSPFSW